MPPVTLSPERPPQGPWDAALARWPAADLLQSHAWGAVQGGAGWRVHRLELDGEPRLPVLVLQGAGALPGRPRLHVPRGPACGPDDLATFARVVAALRQLATTLRAVAVEVEVPWAADAVPPAHPWAAWPRVEARQPVATTVVELARTPEAILASFHAKTRYNVRLAERRGVEVDEGAGLEELLPCLAATAARQRIHLPPPAHFERILAAFGPAAQILAARVEGEVVASALVLRHGATATYLYGGSTDRHRERMPNHLLHWRAMLAARAAGCDRYDLWGIPPAHQAGHPWHGLWQFKVGFGGGIVTLAGARALVLDRRGLRAAQLVATARGLLRGRRRR